MGRLSTLKPPLRVSAFSGGDVSLHHPLDPRRRVMEHRGACAGGMAFRAPRVVSHIPGQTRLTTSLALPRHRSLQAAVPPAQMASPACRRTPMMCSVVTRVLDVQTSFRKGALGDASVPQGTPRSCAGDRHVILPHEESPLGTAELIVFEAVRARRFCDKHGVRLREGCLEHVSHHPVTLLKVYNDIFEKFKNDQEVAPDLWVHLP